jgi:hypothetical protein
MLFIWTSRQVSLRVVNVTWTDLDSLAFILHFFNNFYIASRLVCSFCEAMPGHCQWLILQYHRQMLRLAGLQCIAGITLAPGHCPGVHQLWLGRVPCTQIQTSQESICYADRIRVNWNNSEGEKVLTCTGVQYTILCQTIQICIKMLNNIACFQGLHLSFV